MADVSFSACRFCVVAIYLFYCEVSADVHLAHAVSHSRCNAPIRVEHMMIVFTALKSSKLV